MSSQYDTLFHPLSWPSPAISCACSLLYVVRSCVLVLQLAERCIITPRLRQQTTTTTRLKWTTQWCLNAAAAAGVCCCCVCVIVAEDRVWRNSCEEKSASPKLLIYEPTEQQTAEQSGVA